MTSFGFAQDRLCTQCEEIGTAAGCGTSSLLEQVKGKIGLSLAVVFCVIPSEVRS